MINEKTKVRRILFIPVLLLLIAALSAVVFADDEKPWNKQTAEGKPASSWMSGIADGTELSALNIPGTKNSGMAKVLGPYQNGTAVSETVSYEPAQKKDEKSKESIISNQLSIGVRILEIGLTSEGDAVWDPDGDHQYTGKALYVCDSTESGDSTYLFYALNEGDAISVLTFDQVVDAVKSFLESNTDETVILLLRPEASTQDAAVKEETVRRLNAYLEDLSTRANDTTEMKILYTENGMTQYTKLPVMKPDTGSDCRGRIVILSQFAEADGKNALDYGMLCDPEKDELFSDPDSGWTLSKNLSAADAKTIWLSNFAEIYEVKFVTGNGSKVDSQTVEVGKTAAKPEDPTLSNYSFDGWFTDEGCENPYDFSTPVTGKLTLYAKWVKNVVVHFYLNYSSNQFYRQVKPGDPVEKPETPVRDGYTFEGWYIDEKCQTVYDFSKPVTSELSLYAAWTCTVTFESNGGSEVPSQEVRTDRTATEPSAPRKEGLTFAGWYTNSSLTQPYGFTTKVTKALTLYAKWTALVTFGSNGGTGTMKPVTVNEGQLYSLPSCGFTPPRGYRFDKWDQGAVGSKIEIKGPVSLNAVWKEDSSSGSSSYTGNYNVTFYTNGGSTVPSQSVPYGQAAVRPADPVRQGYEFDNWYTSSQYTTVYDFQSPVTSSLTLFAKWNTSGYYTVSFDANGGSGRMESIKLDRGATFVLPACSFTPPSGKSFVRWNYGETGKSMDVNSDMILIAQWGEYRQQETQEAIYSYTVHFISNGGSEVEDQTVESGNRAVRPEDPTRRGYIFDGWYLDNSRSYPYDFLEPVDSNMTLYAGWVSGVLTGEISYKIESGEDQSYEKDSDSVIRIVVKRSWDDESCYMHFTNVLLDDRILGKERDYHSSSGSTIIVFDNDFLDSQMSGEHWVKISFNDGSVETTLKITGNDEESSETEESETEEAPVTGDPKAQSLTWAAILVLAASGMACLLIILYLSTQRKKERNER